MDWVSEITNGNRFALARALTLIEDRDNEGKQISASLFPLTGKASVIGVTGPPGAGKSTLVDSLVHLFRKEGLKVGVLAVDPSSPFSGGAVLGDRIRMQRHAGDLCVYMRSMGTRGKHGGLSTATREAVLVLDAAGFDMILVETAGVGQTELEIMKVAHTIVVVFVPESGDSIQVMKAGLMEIADIFVVNKSDRPEADKLVRELFQMVHISSSDKKGWEPPVLKTEANREVGVEELARAIERHRTYLKKTPEGARRMRDVLRSELMDLIQEDWLSRLIEGLDSVAGKNLLRQVETRQLDPYSAIKQLSQIIQIRRLK